MQQKESKLLLAAKANDFGNLCKILLKADKAKNKIKSKNSFDVNEANLEGMTALHYAAKYGNIDMIKELLSRGALIDVADKKGWRPLSYACLNNKSETVVQLINNGSNVNSIKEINSPVHIAAAIGNRDIVKILMEKDADIHCQNQKGQTPVDVACENDHYGVVNLLLSASSKQIEEFSASSFRSATKKSLDPVVMRTATLPTAMSSCHINNISVNTSSSSNEYAPYPRELQRYTIGSQESISIPNRYHFQTFKSHSAKKSGSLNEIFLQENENQTNNVCSSGTKSNTLTDPTNKTDMEIMLPYPSKFSTSDILRIKSPLFPLKNVQRKDQILVRNDTSVERTKINQLSNAKRTVTDTDQPQSPRIKNQTTRSSVPFPLHYSIRSDSPSQFVPTEITPPQINGKPPRTSHLYTQKSQNNFATENIRITSPYTRSTSLQECTSGNFKSDLIGATNADREGISCQRWITSIGLAIIWDALVKDGFESFLSLSLATDAELLFMCNNRTDHRNVLTTKLGLLAIPHIDKLMFAFDIQQILIQLGLEQYSTNFIREGYFFVNNLPNISDLLMQQIGVDKIGHRRLLAVCLRSVLQRQSKVLHNTNDIKIKPRSPQETTSDSRVYSDRASANNEMKTKCQSLPRFNMYNTEPTKKSPPPIPPRSCSIPSENPSNHFTLDDVLIESMCQENISPRKKEYCVSENIIGDLSNLDEIANMLANLGRELDSELMHSL